MDPIILIYQMHHISVRCIRSGEYYFSLNDSGHPGLWSYTKNFYAEISITRWCQLFGNQDEKTHYSKLFGDLQDEKLKWLTDRFARANVDKRLLKCINYTQDEYDEFQQNMIDFRNSYVSHWDFDQDGIVIPDLRIAITMRYELIAILKDVARISSQKLHDIQEIIEHSQQNLLNLIDRETTMLQSIATERPGDR